MPTMATSTDEATLRPSPSAWGLRRSVALVRAFRLEQTDPDHFYRFQAADAVAQLERYERVARKLVIDIGGGAGYFTEALTASGARCVLVEPEAAEPEAAEPDDDDAPDAARRAHHEQAVRAGRLAPGRTVAGDGNNLPLPDAVADVTFSSNVLEHVAVPRRFLDEMVRVTRPGGLLYLSFTAWFSPWGGHETAPWHYMGGQRAARRYERRRGRPPKNRYGSSLFACHVGPTLQMARAHPGVEVIDARPRYYPDWLRFVVHVPGVREIVTWNLLLVLRRVPGHRGSSGR